MAQGTSANDRVNLTKVSESVVLAWSSFVDNKILRSTDARSTWADLGEVIPAGIFAITVVNPLLISIADQNGNPFSPAIQTPPVGDDNFYRNRQEILKQ